MKVLQYFSMRKWDFKAERIFLIGKEMTRDDWEEFPVDIENPNIYEYFKASILGGRQYCLKEPLSTLPKARLQHKM
jgi:alcohol-forming fatty acyl-CoA reductase